MILNRNSPIYDEIEKFKDYELTQCIAYEMAIRNPKLKKQINEIVNYYSKIKNVIDYWLDNSKDYNPKVEEKVKKILSMIYNIDSAPIHLMGYDKKDTEMLGEEIYHIIDHLSNSDLEALDRLFPPLYRFNNITMNKTKQGIKTSYIKTIEGFTFNTNITTKEAYKNIDINKVTPNQYHKQILNKIRNHEYIDTELNIIPNFKRPMPKVDNIYLNIANIQVNLNAPLDELISYITHIKNSISSKENNIIQAPVEIFGEDLKEVDKEGLPKKPKGKTYADRFFIYDYVTMRLKDIAKMDNETQNEYQKKADDIQKNPAITGKDKKIQKSELDKELTRNLIDTKIEDICKEEELTNQINLSGSRAYTLYFIMKPYIEDNKYLDFLR